MLECTPKVRQRVKGTNTWSEEWICPELLPILCLPALAVTYVVLPTQNGVIHIGKTIPRALLLAGLHLRISALFGCGRSQ